MSLNKGLLVALLVLLSGCQTVNKSQETNQAKDKISQTPPTSMYDMPNVVDYEKAARLNAELGMGYLTQGNYVRAKSKLVKAVEMAPNVADVNQAYGYYLEKVGEFVEAEKFYAKAVRLDYKNGKSHNNYGAFLCRQGRYQEAEKEFLIALEDLTYSKTAEVLENAGLCIMQVPNLAKAENYFERALKHDPNRYQSLLELAVIKFKNNDYQRAQSYYSTYTKLASPTKRSLLLGLKLAELSGEKDKEASIQLMLNAQYPNTLRNL